MSEIIAHPIFFTVLGLVVFVATFICIGHYMVLTREERDARQRRRDRHERRYDDLRPLNNGRRPR